MRTSISQLLLPLIVVVAVYVLFLRPQRARQRKALELTNSIQPGQRVVTTAGMFATVVALDDEGVLLEVAPDVHVKYVRQAISRVVEPAVDGAGDGGVLNDGVLDDGSAADVSRDDLSDAELADRELAGRESAAGAHAVGEGADTAATDTRVPLAKVVTDTRVQLAKNAPAAVVDGGHGPTGSSGSDTASSALR